MSTNGFLEVNFHHLAKTNGKVECDSRKGFRKKSVLKSSDFKEIISEIIIFRH
jgi:hypothetical protein